jgi:hypothetical protein
VYYLERFCTAWCGLAGYSSSPVVPPVITVKSNRTTRPRGPVPDLPQMPVFRQSRLWLGK